MGRQLISPGLNLRFYNWVLFEIIIDGFRFICFHLNKSPNLSRHVQNLQNMVSTRHTSTYLCNIMLKVACISTKHDGFCIHKIEKKSLVWIVNAIWSSEGLKKNDHVQIFCHLVTCFEMTHLICNLIPATSHCLNI